jgi:hypothetical protein
MWQARSDDMKVLFLSNLNRQVPPKRLCEKPNTVLKSERAVDRTQTLSFMSTLKALGITSQTNLEKIRPLECACAAERKVSG